jgi:hypothetical protein
MPKKQKQALSKKAMVMVLVSAATKIPLREGGTNPTGIFLGELTDPLDALLSAGYILQFASPGGRQSTIDGNPYKSMYWVFSKKKLNHA